MSFTKENMNSELKYQILARGCPKGYSLASVIFKTNKGYEEFKLDRIESSIVVSICKKLKNEIYVYKRN